MKTTKLIILTLLALVMPIDVVAQLVIKDEQGVEYSLSDREATVVGYAAPEGAEEGKVDIKILNLISVRQNTYIVKGIAAGAFKDNNYLRSVEIQSVNINIATGAFSNCPNLEAITLTVGATINENAFSGLFTRAKLMVMESRQLRVIPASWGKNATGFVKIVVCEGITAIRASAFEGLSELVAVVLPSTLSPSPTATTPTIGDNAFAGCSSLMGVTMNGSDPVSVGNDVFDTNRFDLLTIEVPAGSREAWAASDYWKKIPNITDNYYIDSNGLRYLITWDVSSQRIAECVGVAEGFRSPKTVYIPEHNDDDYKLATIDLPNGTSYPVKTIAASAFENNTTIEELHVACGVDRVCDKAFSGCTHLKKVYVTSDLEGSGAFNDSGLFDVEMRIGLNSNGLYTSHLFYHCNSVKNAIVHEGFVGLTGSFWGCTNLETATIPSTVNKIAQTTFRNCTSLTDVYFAREDLSDMYINVVSDPFPLPHNSFKLHLTAENVGRAVASCFQKVREFNGTPSNEYYWSDFFITADFDGYSYRFQKVENGVDAPEGNPVATLLAPLDKSVTSINIPSSIKCSIENFKVNGIASDAFSACNQLETVVVNWATPIDVSPDVTVPLAPSGQKLTLIVPNGTYHLYKNHAFWGKYFNISENLVINGDLEGEDNSCFFAMGEPREDFLHNAFIVLNPGVNGSACIQLTTKENPTSIWGTRFYIRLTESLPKGTKFYVSFDCKAENDASNVITHYENEPNQDVDWGGIGRFQFTDSWKHYEGQFIVPDNCDGNVHDGGKYTNDFRTINFNLADPQNTNPNTYYFDNIVVAREGMIDLVKNGTLEGTNTSCFYAVEEYVVGDSYEVIPSAIVPATIVNRAGKGSMSAPRGSRGIRAKTHHHAQIRNSQFFLRLPQTLPQGTKYHVSFYYKASEPATMVTYAAAEPGEYINLTGIGEYAEISVTREWQHYDYSGTINEAQSPSNNMQTVAFELAQADSESDPIFYFDNIVFEIDADHYTGAVDYYVPVEDKYGDANNDNTVSVTDIAVVVNHILSLANGESFTVAGADANGDGDVTVTDIGVIVDTILGSKNNDNGNGSNAGARKLEQELEPQ